MLTPVPAVPAVPGSCLPAPSSVPMVSALAEAWRHRGARPDASNNVLAFRPPVPLAAAGAGASPVAGEHSRGPPVGRRCDIGDNASTTSPEAMRSDESLSCAAAVAKAAIGAKPGQHCLRPGRLVQGHPPCLHFSPCHSLVSLHRTGAPYNAPEGTWRRIYHGVRCRGRQRSRRKEPLPQWHDAMARRQAVGTPRTHTCKRWQSLGLCTQRVCVMHPLCLVASRFARCEAAQLSCAPMMLVNTWLSSDDRRRIDPKKSVSRSGAT